MEKISTTVDAIHQSWVVRGYWIAAAGGGQRIDVSSFPFKSPSSFVEAERKQQG